MITGLIYDIKPFAIHDGPGIRSSVFFKGCPLDCSWCHNPESKKAKPEVLIHPEQCFDSCSECVIHCPRGALTRHPRIRLDTGKCRLEGVCATVCPADAIRIVGRRVAPRELLDELEKDGVFFDQSGGGITLTGGEPLLQIDFLTLLLREARARSLAVTLDTCGYAPWADLKPLLSLVDTFLYDLKIIDPRAHRAHTGKDNAPILENLKKLSRIHPDIQARIPVIPAITDSDENLAGILRFLREKAPGIRRVALLEYHPLGNAKSRQLGRAVEKIEYDPGKLKKKIQKTRKKFQEEGLEVTVGG